MVHCSTGTLLLYYGRDGLVNHYPGGVVERAGLGEMSRQLQEANSREEGRGLRMPLDTADARPPWAHGLTAPPSQVVKLEGPTVALAPSRRPARSRHPRRRGGHHITSKRPGFTGAAQPALFEGYGKGTWWGSGTGINSSAAQHGPAGTPRRAP